ncbi:DUF3558 family protein [Actinacidiphila sp. ITFR-21]|uniref:DUF3558 family protein n=1 Tax=Actinacidiphila sp. ITFR-21 TaxID=3075199 RepID=UPI00288B98B4|nr:DUF3558 family protein [Streptomyces sp. ITFR-21]WNI18022.1 DUF3558 family protein [Streptomyces sp. ITFR-21]
MRRTAIAVCLLLAALTGCAEQAAPSVTSAASASASASPGGALPPSGAAATAAPARTVLKACEILPEKDAEALATTPLNAGIEAPANTPGCTYTAPVDGPVAQVEIYLGDGAKKYYDIDRQLNHAFTPFTGAGEEAYAEDDTVFFRKAVTWVAIRLVRLNDPAVNREPLRSLARQVASRL